MGGQDKSADLVELRELFRRWTALVEFFTRRRSSGHRMRPREYCELHLGLLKACHQSQVRQAERTRQELFKELEKLAKPWGSLQSLATANRQVLSDLLVRCRQAEGVLNDQAGSFTSRQWVAGMCLLAIALVAGTVLVVLTWDTPAVRSVVYEAQAVFARASFAIRRLGFTGRFVLITTIVVIVAIRIVVNSARRY